MALEPVLDKQQRKASSCVPLEYHIELCKHLYDVNLMDQF